MLKFTSTSQLYTFPNPAPPRVTVVGYTDKDQVGDYTMLPGDVVLFNLAVDRRDRARRATNVRLHCLSEEQKNHSDREVVSEE